MGKESVGGSASQTAHSAQQKAEETMSQAKEESRETAGEIEKRARETVSSAKEQAKRTASMAKEKLTGTGRQAVKRMERAKRRAEERIHARTREHLRESSRSPEMIERRMCELDREWDVQQAVGLAASSVILASAALIAMRRSAWAILPAVMGGLLLEHAIQGWNPTVPLARMAGIRTRKEIEAERYALKAMRGDFRDVPTSPEQPESFDWDRLLQKVRA